jgi:dienelactone hydrolase
VWKNHVRTQQKRLCSLLHLGGDCDGQRSARPYQILGSVQRDGYTELEVAYAHDQPGFPEEHDEHITGYILIPARLRGPAPAVLFIHVNGSNWQEGADATIGPSGIHDRGTAVELVRRGFVVHAPDVFGFGKRLIPSIDPPSPGRPVGADGYQNAYIRRAVGCQPLAGKTVSDLRCGIDVLLGLSEVDPRSIAVAGFSFGGELGTLLGAVDSRIGVAATHCGVVSHACMRERVTKIDFNKAVPGIPDDFGDIDAVLALFAGRLIRVSATRQDKYCWDAAAVCAAAAERLRAWGAPDSIVFQQYRQQGHSFNRGMRLGMWRFLERAVRTRREGGA